MTNETGRPGELARAPGFAGVFMHVFADDGRFPNSRLPLIVYKAALLDAGGRVAAAQVEACFDANHWSEHWRNGVYDYQHYHSMAHETLGCYAGRAVVRLGGGTNGLNIEFAAGDCILIPAGVAHMQIEASRDFRVVGAYTGGQTPDLLRGLPGERPAADQRIAALALPAADPVLGPAGPVMRLWG
jgi:uncharacterized protein YjlB